MLGCASLLCDWLVFAHVHSRIHCFWSLSSMWKSKDCRAQSSITKSRCTEWMSDIMLLSLSLVVKGPLSSARAVIADTPLVQMRELRSSTAVLKTNLTKTQTVGLWRKEIISSFIEALLVSRYANDGDPHRGTFVLHNGRTYLVLLIHCANC